MVAILVLCCAVCEYEHCFFYGTVWTLWSIVGYFMQTFFIFYSYGHCFLHSAVMSIVQYSTIVGKCFLLVVMGIVR
jgi:hypothetical protein